MNNKKSKLAHAGNMHGGGRGHASIYPFVHFLSSFFPLYIASKTPPYYIMCENSCCRYGLQNKRALATLN